MQAGIEAQEILSGRHHVSTALLVVAQQVCLLQVGRTAGSSKSLH